MKIWSEILRGEATLFRTIFNHYRPELHYMRGPGPKWLEKHRSRSEPASPWVANSARPKAWGSRHPERDLAVGQ
jgi:hypothetical protein